VKAGQLLFELERQSEAAALDQAGKISRKPRPVRTLAAVSTYQRIAKGTPVKVRPPSVRPRNSTSTDGPRHGVAPRSAAHIGALDKAQWSVSRQHIRPANALAGYLSYRQGEWVAAGNPVIACCRGKSQSALLCCHKSALPQVKFGTTRQGDL